MLIFKRWPPSFPRDRISYNLSMNATPSVETENELFVRLYTDNLIPMYVVLASLILVICDYFATLEDEVRYMWTQKRGWGKALFFWIRYYTIFLVVYDTLQIHGFVLLMPGIVNHYGKLRICIASDLTSRILGGICLWSVEIIMQLRIYALFYRKKKIAAFNASLFALSIAFFIGIMILNAGNRRKLIEHVLHMPLPGCPAINGGIQWALWVPATIFELMLFSLVMYKCAVSSSAHLKLNGRASLISVLIHENTLYFFVVACLLIFNNLMTVGATRIPWFSFGPFHGAMGIITSRVLIHIRKFALRNLEGIQTIAKLPDLEAGPASQALTASQPSESVNPEMRCIDLKSRIRQKSQNSPVSIISESWSEIATESHSFNLAIGQAGPSRIG